MSANGTYYTNVTHLDHWTILTHVENTNIRKLVSAIVYLGLLIILGILGNTLVLIVYTVRIRHGTTRIFILALAIIDLLNNIFGMSGEIIDLAHSYTFTSPLMCKIIRFNNYITVFSSIYTLIAVAIDRYRKVCRPHLKQITEQGAKYMVAISVVAAMAMTVPALIINGIHTFNLTPENIDAFECTFTNEYQNTVYPKLLVGTQFIIFVVAVNLLSVLYIMIGREIFIHSRFSFRGRSAEKKAEFQEKITALSNETAHFTKAANICIIPEESSQVVDTGPFPGNTARKSMMVAKKQKKDKARKIKNKTTLMLVAISAIFILSCLPYLSISVMKRLKADFVSSMTDMEYKLYNICLRSYFINSAANPIVYSFCNARFRQEVVNVISNIR